jgi:uncharacterized sulfatase
MAGAITTLSAWGSSPKPNLVLFLADDCSYFDIGVYGSKDSGTPNINRFAAEGIRFTRGYQAAPMCSPTRHNLYTGIWPVITGAYPNHTTAYEGTKSIVHHLKPAGYRVALIGKTHVLPQSTFPFEYIPTMEGQEINFAPIDTFITSCARSNTPYCMFVATNQPHEPWNKGDASLFNPGKIALPPFYVDTETTRNEFCKYLAEVNYMDDEFGRMLRKIDQHKQQDNTVVVYLSEQGNSLPFAKWTCYDVGVRSAFIVRWPGKIVPGTVSGAIVEYCDIVPTFTAIAGLKPVCKVSGRSILPLLLQQKKEGKKYTYSLQTTKGIVAGSEYFGIRSVADRKYRYIINLTPEMTFKNLTTSDPLFQEWLKVAETDEKAKELTWKYQHRPAVELYNLENDRYCLTNLAQDRVYKKVIAGMDKALRGWMKECGDKGQETELDAWKHKPGKNFR